MNAKTEILFEIVVPYDRTILAPIQKLAVKFGPWESDKKAYKATFYLKDLSKVLALTKQKIEFDARDIEDIAEFCPPLKENIPIYGDKGIDNIKVTEFPKYYEIVEHRKQEDGTVKQLKHEIPRANVDAVGEIINELPLDATKTHKWLAEKVCRKLNLERFFREGTNTFDSQKWWGARGDLMKFTYWPLKVCQTQGIVKYHKDGTFERKKEYVVQTVFPTSEIKCEST